MIDKALDRAIAYPGVDRDPARERGLLVDPQILLQSQGIPVQLASPGGWTIACDTSSLDLSYES
jgi:hypothetical protein